MDNLQVILRLRQGRQKKSDKKDTISSALNSKNNQHEIVIGSPLAEVENFESILIEHEQRCAKFNNRIETIKQETCAMMQGSPVSSDNDSLSSPLLSLPSYYSSSSLSSSSSSSSNRSFCSPKLRPSKESSEYYRARKKYEEEEDIKKEAGMLARAREELEKREKQKSVSYC